MQVQQLTHLLCANHCARTRHTIRPPVRIGPRDFELLSVIGMGAFGKVLQVRSRRNGQICAMKCISKKMLEKKNHASYMKAERDIMARVDHPFIVGLKCAFQTDRKLFLVVSDTPLITSR
jgi:serine/threonine protein kinase